MSVNGIGQNYYQNYISTNKCNRSKAGQFYQQKQAAEASASTSTRQNANVRDIYEAHKSTNPLMGQESVNGKSCLQMNRSMKMQQNF